MNYYIDTPNFIRKDATLSHAFNFAMVAHASVQQIRKYTGEPYIVHPVEVADIMRVHGGTVNQMAAALLHDVVEDTPVTPLEIVAHFGTDISALVMWLTDVSTPEDGNRATRKGMDRQHSIAAPAEAQSVKVADLISNSNSIIKYDPNFAVTFMREKALLLKGLKKADKKLLDKAKKIVKNYKRK